MRRGFVLVAVLFALVLLAALTAAGFFAALQERRAGANAAALLRTQTAASSALSEILVGWNPALMDSLHPGAVMTSLVTPSPGATVQVEVRRLNRALFLLRAVATDSSAARALMTVARLRGLDFDQRAAARVRSLDPTLIARIDGVDRAPPGWTCPATTDTIVTVIQQSGASDSVFLRFGNRSWADVLAWVARVPRGGDSLISQHWPGNLALSASRLTGLVVVEGDLTLDGGSEVTGLVLIRGSLILRGTGGTIHGAVVASQLVTASGYSSTQPAVVFSSCAVGAAALGRAWPMVLRGSPRAPIF